MPVDYTILETKQNECRTALREKSKEVQELRRILENIDSISKVTDNSDTELARTENREIKKIKPKDRATGADVTDVTKLGL